MILPLLPPPVLILCSALLLQKPSPILALTNSEQSGHFVSVGSSRNVIFHPSTGSCVLRTSLYNPLKLGPCDQSDSWSYTPQKILLIEGTYFCLQAGGSGKPASLGVVCTEADSRWAVISKSKKHNLSTELSDGSSVCLDVDTAGTVMTNPCTCLSSGGVCSSDSQWFVITTQTEGYDDENTN